MKILAHRGFWENSVDKNSMEAFARAFRSGYGIETDVRDFNGELVVSHNIADESCIQFEDVLKMYEQVNVNLPIAINIKADGLQEKLLMLIRKYKLDNAFVFDMSVPEQVVYAKKQIPFFSRLSELETVPVQYDLASGIWMDEWEKEWITKEGVEKYVKNGKLVGVISPEIHGREYEKLWKDLKCIQNLNFMLCTDIPEKAKGFFYE
jgi:hypothetical protein